jgi:hypothetical protein
VGVDIHEWTRRILEEGLPPLPSALEPGKAVPIAMARGERHGAVLFIPLWKNGNVDCDCAIAERGEDGSWREAQMSGGSGWIANPLVRSETGWDGDPVLWLGRTGMGSTAFPQDEDEPWPEPEPGKLGVHAR